MATRELVTLRSGLAVSIDALALLWSLEERRFELRVADDGLRVRPQGRLTEADDVAIRQHHADLAALIRYADMAQ